MAVFETKNRNSLNEPSSKVTYALDHLIAKAAQHSLMPSENMHDKAVAVASLVHFVKATHAATEDTAHKKPLGNFDDFFNTFSKHITKKLIEMNVPDTYRTDSLKSAQHIAPLMEPLARLIILQAYIDLGGHMSKDVFYKSLKV